MRCDLHVHTLHSGMCGVPLLKRICRESYNDPQALYETLKRRGMDLVTVSDHDSIDAAESLRHYPDFFLSEEVTCTTPSGTEIHVGVYDIAEKQHTELQRRRNDLLSLISYLHEQRLFFSINHVFSGLTGRREEADFALFEEFFPGMETINGHMPPSSNDYATELARRWRKAVVGGSDAHTLAALGLTYTEIPGAVSMATYLDGLKLGHARVCGISGSYLKLTRAVLEIGLRLVGDKAWTVLLAPLLLAVPLVTMVNYLGDVVFADKWARQVMNPDVDLLPAKYLQDIS